MYCYEINEQIQRKKEKERKGAQEQQLYKYKNNNIGLQSDISVSTRHIALTLHVLLRYQSVKTEKENEWTRENNKYKNSQHCYN